MFKKNFKVFLNWKWLWLLFFKKLKFWNLSIRVKMFLRLIKLWINLDFFFKDVGGGGG